MADSAQLPLRGTIVCCTSIPPEQRSEFGSYVEQMGGVHNENLTSDATHLIVGDTDTPKYKFVAKHRSDVQVVLPSWIEAVRASWLEGGSTDVEALQSDHKLPTYHGLRVCITGFEDPDQRKQLEDEVQKAGGEYYGNLTKDVTHLIATKPGSEKYEYAQKHREIRIVSIEWHQQSLDRGMILEEALYHPLLPVEERGRGAWTPKVMPTTSLGKRAREGTGGSQTARKLRRTASSKFENHNDSLWTDIVGAEVKTEKAQADAWSENARVEEDTPEATEERSRANTKMKCARVEDQSKTSENSQSLSSVEPLLNRFTQAGPVFQGCSFLLQGFDKQKTAIITTHLESHGANLLEDASQFPPKDAYLVVPFTTRRGDVDCSVDVPNQPQFVTELWIERCLHRKHYVNPLENVTNTPFKKFPILGFENINISSTGFKGVDLMNAARIIRMMGSTYYEYFTEKSGVLICNNVTPENDKLRHAQMWSVPAVKAEWLWDCIQGGKLLPFDDYLVQPLSVPADSRSERSERLIGGIAAPASDTKQTAKDVAPEKAFKRPALSKEQSRQTKREAKRLLSLGSSFPDDAGPLLNDDAYHDASNASVDFLPQKADKNAEMNSISNHKAPKPAPLNEITPNSSPPKPYSLQPEPTSFVKPPTETNENEENEDTLGPTISSLLSHHQKQRSSMATKLASNPDPKSSSNPDRPLRRHRRQLLGRAPSNISSYSINLSRASSVDTMNTDGLGTPLEVSHSHHGSTNTINNSATAAAAAAAAKKTSQQLQAIYDTNHDDPDRPQDEHLQMTQLGYEDPDVAAWRERVAIKMSGGNVKGGGTPGRTKRDGAVDGGGGKRGDKADKEVKGKGLGISTRTRLATGGR